MLVVVISVYQLLYLFEPYVYLFFMVDVILRQLILPDAETSDHCVSPC